ncbi:MULTISPECIES: acyl-CoA synthetase family protein [Kitasatospora]|uniref:HPr domain-containing protein n=1 Tax=Kitasatospora cathayae TaxID=3004092 RepID=A0ABY7QCB1_9ACTN|nr:hypothetical protein [Kitasatospora sp. HUAS 3-15]WBP90390.1 hypothetical protein O1G21_34050 [Kitasatospora sp. HUAS 3-15]
MASTPALVSALRELGDRPAVVADGRSISGIGLLLGVSPPGGLPRALAARVAEHAALPPSAARAAEDRLRHWAGVLGPPPIRHTVLHPATDLAVELALATLLAGGTVHCADPDQRPEQQLTALAANGTTHLSLPSALLWQLSRQPGLAEHDLAALRLVLHVGPEPRQDDVYAAVDALGAVLAHVRAPHSQAEAADRRLRAATEAATAAAWKYSIGITAEQITEFGAHLDRAVLTALLHALQQTGVLTDPARGWSEPELLATALVTPAQRPRVARWLDALARHGLITRQDGGAQGPLFHGAPELTAAEVRDAWRPAVETWTDGLGTATVLDRVRRGALRLPKLLTGEEAPRPAAAPVRWAAARGYLGAALGALVRATAEAHDGPKTLRVLELDRDGAETAIARALAARPRQNADHHLAPDGGRYDVVVATAGGHPEEEVPALVELLAPGGRLLLLAPVTEQLDLLITGDPRGLTAHPADHWRAALTAAGCPTVLTLPEDGHPMGLLGQGLFVARVD